MYADNGRLGRVVVVDWFLLADDEEDRFFLEDDFLLVDLKELLPWLLLADGDMLDDEVSTPVLLYWLYWL